VAVDLAPISALRTHARLGFLALAALRHFVLDDFQACSVLVLRPGSIAYFRFDSLVARL